MNHFHLTLCANSAVLHQVPTRGAWRVLHSVQASSALQALAQLGELLQPEISRASAKNLTYGQHPSFWQASNVLSVTCANNLGFHFVVKPALGVRNLNELKNLAAAQARAQFEIGDEYVVQADWRASCTFAPFAASALPRNLINAVHTLAQQNGWVLEQLSPVWAFFQEKKQSFALCDGSSLGVALFSGDKKLLSISHFSAAQSNAEATWKEIKNLALLQGAALPATLPIFGVRSLDAPWLKFNSPHRLPKSSADEALQLANYLQEMMRGAA